MNDMRYMGCRGGECPKQGNCARFLEQGTEDRPHTFYTPPYNNYNHGDRTEFRCGYQEYPQAES